MDTAPSLSFGDLLRRYRTAAALTQEELAERAGLSVRGISDLERGVKLRPHRDTVRLLADALQLSPEEQAMLAAAVRSPVSGAGATSVPADRTNLPVQLSSFVGRQREMDELGHLLEHARLLTLTGPGGTGKTRLAVQVAAALSDRYAHGVWLVELAPLADPALVPQAVATVLGVRGDSDRSPLDSLCATVQARHLLLVLDNCEHLLDACAALAEALLRAGPRLRILATSREALGGTGETVWRVPALSLPDNTPHHSPETLLASEAVQLFVERAAAVRPHFAVTAANAPAVAQVCRRLDGIPLAIELAAARIGALSVEQLAARLDRRFGLLTGGNRTALPRQQTLRATVNWSYALLSAAEQTLFNRLSVFAGGFTLEAAETVCAGEQITPDAVLALLLRLVDRSLVLAEERDDGDTRYRLLETLRQYGQERLLETGEAPVMQAQHAAYYLTLAEQADQAMHGPLETVWLDRLDAEYGNLAAALDWCLADGESSVSDAGTARVETGLRLSGALWWFWLLRGHRWAGLRWLERALAQNRDAAASVRAKALLGSGFMTMQLGNYGHGRALLEESVAMYREIGEQRSLAYALCFLGYHTRGEEVGFDIGHQGNYERGTALLEEGLVLARMVGEPRLIMWVLVFLANTTDVHQDRERAYGRIAAEEGLTLARSVGGDYVMCMLQRTLGGIALYEGAYTQARVAFSGELAAAHAAHDRGGIANALSSLGDVARAEGKYAEATARYEESLALYRELDFDQEWMARVLRHLGEVALDQGDVVLARSRAIESLLAARDLAERGVPQIGPALEVLAGVAAAQGLAERALRLAGAAAALRERLRQTPWPVEAEALARWLAPARQVLTAAVAEAAWSEGQALPLEQAMAYALEERS